VLKWRDTLDVLELPIHCPRIECMLLVPVFNDGLVSPLFGRLLSLVVILHLLLPVNLLPLGHLLSNDHLRKGFLCLNPLQELLLREFRVRVQVQSTDDRLAVFLSGLGPVVLKKSVQVADVDVPVAPVINHLVDCLRGVIELRFELLLQFLTLTV
jgi:hypothetical protein